jgi:predicted RND superfamily exporter protein
MGILIIIGVLVAIVVILLLTALIIPAPNQKDQEEGEEVEE